MSVVTRYLQYLSEICAGTRKAPDGIDLHETDDLRRAMELQEAAEQMGIAPFVEACARQDGETVSPEELAAFDPQQLAEAVRQLASQAAPEEPGAQTAPQAEDVPARTEIRDIFEVFLDSVSLDDRLVQYLIDILRRGAKEEFRTLSHAAARTILEMDDFLTWLGNKELLADERERACAAICDAFLDRLWREGEKELAAALISGDETTFRIFRTEAPELVHLPEATYEWFCENYLDRYYPIRFFLRCSGVEFPKKRKEQ